MNLVKRLIPHCKKLLRFKSNTSLGMVMSNLIHQDQNGLTDNSHAAGVFAVPLGWDIFSVKALDQFR